MDTSNFPDLERYEKYLQPDCKGKLGAIKSETNVVPIKEFIGLSPKCYSLLLADNSIKSTSKGVNRCQQKQVTHDHYRKMLDKNINLRVPCVNIVSKNLSLQTVRTEKLALSVIDRKRHWFDDNTSVGYGHYSLINKKRKVENEIRSPRIQKSHPVKRYLSYIIHRTSSSRSICSDTMTYNSQFIVNGNLVFV